MPDVLNFDFGGSGGLQDVSPGAMNDWRQSTDFVNRVDPPNTTGAATGGNLNPSVPFPTPAPQSKTYADPTDSTLDPSSTDKLNRMFGQSPFKAPSSDPALNDGSTVGNAIGKALGLNSGNTSTSDFIRNYFIRIVLVILGFIFIAFGLYTLAKGEPKIVQQVVGR